LETTATFLLVYMGQKFRSFNPRFYGFKGGFYTSDKESGIKSSESPI